MTCLENGRHSINFLGHRMLQCRLYHAIVRGNNVVTFLVLPGSYRDWLSKGLALYWPLS